MLGCGRRIGGRIPIGVGGKMEMVGMVASPRAK